MIRKTAELIVEVFISIFVIICVSALPTLFNDISFNFFAFLVEVKNILLSLLHPQDITYGWDTERSIYPKIFINYKETLILIIATILISIVISFALTYLTLLVFQKKKSKIKWFLTMVESLPDIFYIFLFQFLTIVIYQKTGRLLFNVASAGDDRALFLPIICLTLPLVLLLTKFLIQQFETEGDKLYVEYAIAKGMTPFYIFNIHIFKNVLFSLFYYSKTLIWFAISNLVIMEYLFNMTGIVNFIYDHQASEIFVVGILMLYIPIFLFYRISEWIISSIVRGEVID